MNKFRKVIRLIKYKMGWLPEYRASTLKDRTLDMFRDIKNFTPEFKPKLMIDIGAYEGDVTKAFLKVYPGTKAILFEPCFEKCQELLDKNFAAYGIAISNINGLASFTSGLGAMNKLNKSGPKIVLTRTLDTFCNKFNIRHIDFIKIDTEGNELKVLEGAKQILSKARATYLCIESGMNPENKYHCSFDEIKKVMEGYGYYIFGIYNQRYESIAMKPQLRRADVVFIKSV